MIRKVRVSTVAAEAAEGDVSRTPDIAQGTRVSLVDRLASSSIGRPMSNRGHVPTLVELFGVEINAWLGRQDTTRVNAKQAIVHLESEGFK